MHRRLLALAGNSRLALAITILSGLLAGFLTISQAWLLSSTVNGVFLEGRTLVQVADWLKLILLMIAGRALLTWVNEVSANAVAVGVKTDLRRKLFDHILQLGPAYTRGQRTGDLTTAAVEGIEALDAYFSQYLPQLVISALVPLSILIFVFPIDLLSAFILLVTAPLIPFFMVLIGKGAEAVTRRQYETLSRLSAHFLDSLQGLTTLKVFGGSKAHARVIAQVSDQFRDTTLGVLRITFLSALALELLATLSTAIIAVEIGLRLLYARVEFREAFFLLILAPEFYLPLRMLGLRFHAGMAGTSAGRRIFQILETPIPIREPEPGQRQSTPANPDSRFLIHFEHVTFTYPGETQPALQNIDLKIHRGEQMALVGVSGAGKSTLVHLLLGFIQPTQGQLLVNDQPLDLIDLDSWRAQIGWVPQKPHLFHDTIEANIRLGKPDATGQEVIAAARAAHLHEFITSLPDGYETQVGEGGARLSGGQAQRLALARAFLRDAPVLILDEPTSSLDPETETLLEDSTRRLMQGRTVLTIAHRLNTVFNAGRIIVLEAGRLIEAGTHRELLAGNGAYAKMVGIPAVIPASDEPRTFAPSVALPPSALNLRPSTDQPSAFQKPEPSILRRLLSFLKGSWNWVALSILLGTLTIASNVSLMGTSAWLISTAALHPSIADLGVSIVGVRFFGISRGVFRYVERLVSHNVTFQLLAHLRIWFYERLEPLAPARLMEYRAGDLLARLIGDVETLENFYVRVVAPPLTGILTALCVSVFLASYDRVFALILIGFFLAIGIILPLISRTLSRLPGRDLIAVRADLHTQLVEGIQGLADLLAFGRAADRAAALASTDQTYGGTQRHMARISGLGSALVLLLSNLGAWTVLFLAIPHVTAGEIEGVMLGALTLITLASFEAVAPLPLAAQMWVSTCAAAQRLFDIVDTEPLVKDDHRDTGIASRGGVAGPDDELSIAGLSFTYPMQTVPALQQVTLTVPAGKSVAIVGPSGAGKSTLTNLLLRFWEYDSGEIRIGGRSLHALDQDDVRKRCTLVSQASYFFNTTIRENLRLARPSATLEQMESAVRDARIHEFIASLPKGYDTFIGEQGLRLSGGERQRLAIARALLKDASILILDEPTANLDPLTEGQVLEALFGVMKSKTTLLITHRLIGLDNLDEILVMDHGRIVERGIHQDLLRRKGLYRRLWDLQNRIFA